LSPEHKITILKEMKSAIHAGIRKMILRRTYDHFKRCLHSAMEFEPEDIWDRLEDTSRDHYNHSLEYVEKIEGMIDIEQAKITERVDGHEPNTAPNLG
jgi:hypothetical protein